MNIRPLIVAIFSLFVVVTSCKKDDEEIQTIPLRDRAEVYAEDIEEIEDFLSTHFYNYEEFDFDDPYAAVNDGFTVRIDSIDEDNQDKTSILDSEYLTTKMVKQGGIDYKLYILKLRDGNGDSLHNLDRAIVKYNGIRLNLEAFDSAITPIRFNLTSVGLIGGVVDGFREGLTDFKTASSFVDNPDGTTTYKGGGIGAIFIPSGLGYFASAPPSSGIGAYNPIIFSVNLVGRTDTDFDNDNVPSHLEDLDGDGNGFNDNTDGDDLPNFIDSDDDNDGVLTSDEDLEDTDPDVDSDGDGNPTNDRDGDGDPTNDGINPPNDTTPNYLDPNAKESN